MMPSNLEAKNFDLEESSANLSQSRSIDYSHD